MKNLLTILLIQIIAMPSNAQQRSVLDINSLLFNEICVANIDQIIDYSNNYGSWAELYNPTDTPISLDVFYISDDAQELNKHRLVGYGTIAPNQYVCVFFDHNALDGTYGSDANKQVRFKLNRQGGTLYLSKDGNEVYQTIVYPKSIARCSYARIDAEGEEWMYCGQPTPSEANSGHFATEALDMPEVDVDSKLFTEPFVVQVAIPEGTTLRYTTDGCTPTLTVGHTSADGCFHIKATTSLRLRLFADGMLPSGVVTRTFIHKDKEYYLPIVAITTNPGNLYDNQIGCYVNGKNGVAGRGSKVKSNLNMDWERPVNFEYWTADGQMVINQETSFEVVGGYSRHFAPASFKVQAKKLYDGNGSFKTPIFPHKPYQRYKQLLVRNGGNNNRTDGGPRIKDAITQQVLTSSGFYLDAQEYQPVHVFVNGQYLAMMNVREPNNRFHGCANYGYDNDEIDGFEYSGGVYQQKGGSREAFDRMIALSETADTEEGYKELSKVLDIDEFVHYMAAICYTSSYDWLLNGNNVKGYRTQDEGKFHFVFFDQDLAWERTNNVETIDGVTTNEVLVLYNNLKRNKTFRQQFVASYAILHGSVYTPERCTQIADSICALIKKALSYDRRTTDATYNKMKKEMWSEDYRRARVKSLMNAYGLQDSINVTLSTNTPHARIRIEGQEVPLAKFKGVLFGSTKLSADCSIGYSFLGWQDGHGTWLTKGKDLLVTEDGTYVAVFDDHFSDDVSPVCINETSASNDIFVNDYGKAADWIELYNRGNEPVDVASWYFGNEEDHSIKYQIDANDGVNTVIQPGDYLVVWCDGKPSRTQPHLPFKLSNAAKGCLYLLSENLKWSDIFMYGEHSSKEAIGRYPDGGSDIFAFYNPTIGKRNHSSSYDNKLENILDAIRDTTTMQSEKIVSITFYSLDGIHILRPKKGTYIKKVLYKDGHHESMKIVM